MAGPIADAFVEIRADDSRFAADLRGSVDAAVAAADESLVQTLDTLAGHGVDTAPAVEKLAAALRGIADELERRWEPR